MNLHLFFLRSKIFTPSHKNVINQGASGPMPESEIKVLLKRLGESVNEALSNSPEIHDSIREIRNAGYEVFLSVETKIVFSSAGGESRKNGMDVNEKPACPDMTEYDANFLKTLKIAIN